MPDEVSLRECRDKLVARNWRSVSVRRSLTYEHQIAIELWHTGNAEPDQK